ncbi:MAG: hypothetical protein OER95_18710 [Acidimicrobiia bacterium]|nr:hypothetical protein [Acidimicrobiia bacterium]
MSDRLDHSYCSNSIVMCREHRPARSDHVDWLGVFRELQDQLDVARHQTTPVGGGPPDLAITVVAEALAVAVALNDAFDVTAGQASGQAGSALDKADIGLDPEPTAVYASMDCRYLHHRARALRSALHLVDDYIWWAGLGTERAAGLATDQR